jgi:hypothetical protein
MAQITKIPVNTIESSTASTTRLSRSRKESTGSTFASRRENTGNRCANGEISTIITATLGPFTNTHLTHILITPIIPTTPRHLQGTPQVGSMVMLEPILNWASEVSAKEEI